MAADGEAKSAGILPGSLVQRIGGRLLGTTIDVGKSLLSHELPVAIEFVLPHRDQELSVDLSILSFTLRVEAFRTGTILGDVQMQKATVVMPEVSLQSWKGTLMGLLKYVGRAQATAVAKDLPGLIQSLKFASKTLETTVASALYLLEGSRSLRASVARQLELPSQGASEGPKIQQLEGNADANKDPEGEADMITVTSPEKWVSIEGLGSSAVTTVSGAAAVAGGLVCDVVARGQRRRQSHPSFGEVLSRWRR
jgi:hypothetical protein